VTEVVTMEMRRLGRLGHQSSVLIYGAAALGGVSQDVADASIQEALDGGINHFDVAASYGDAELRLGPWMPQIRDRIFWRRRPVAVTVSRPGRRINGSLQRLQTDRVDLLQLHGIGDLGELDLATGSAGALKAAVRALDEGLVGAVGVTGHGPEAAQTPPGGVAAVPVRDRADPAQPGAVARRHLPGGVPGAGRRDPPPGCRADDHQDRVPAQLAQGADHSYATWYEPYDDQATITAAVSWVLAHDEVTGIPTAGDVGLLGMLLLAERNRISPRRPNGSCPVTTTIRHRSSRRRSEPCTGSTDPGAAG
jgi:hypothetical protein